MRVARLSYYRQLAYGDIALGLVAHKIRAGRQIESTIATMAVVNTRRPMIDRLFIVSSLRPMGFPAG